MPESRRHVTVVGAGIVGIASACYLQRDGYDVTLVDRGQPGEGASQGNGGLLAPGSIVPLSMPGVLKQVPKWLLDPDAPFAMRWGYAPKAASWLLRFVKEATWERALRSAAAQRAITGPTFACYEPLLKNASATHLVQRTGYVYVYDHEETYQKSQKTWEIRKSLGVRTRVMSGQEFREMEPAFTPAFARAVHLPDEGYCINPLDMSRALAGQIVKDGGTVLQREVRGFHFGLTGPDVLETDGGPLPLDILVVAAGAFSKPLAKQLGSDVPLETLRGYNITINNPGPRPKVPVMVADRKFGLTPLEPNLLRVSGIAEIAGLTAPPSPRRKLYFASEASRLIEGLDVSDATSWLGHRPALPDSVPVICKSPNYPNVYFAFGHGIAGLTGASKTGALVADLVSGRKPDIDMSPYRIDRF